MSSSLGNVAHCDTLIAREIGSLSRPLETIYAASNFQIQGGDVTTAGNLTAVNITGSGSIQVGKNTDVISHFGRGRIGHFDITNPQTGATSSSVSFSHHDCSTGTNFSVLQTEDGETLLNSNTGKHLEFRLGGVEKMRLHTNGFLGISRS